MQNHSSESAIKQENDPISLLAAVKPEAVPFLNAHGCTVQPHAGGTDLVTFPVGSRQERRQQARTRCSNILLPDGTCITAMDCYSKHILLVIDFLLGCTTHLTH